MVGLDNLANLVGWDNSVGLDNLVNLVGLFGFVGLVSLVWPQLEFVGMSVFELTVSR